MVRPIWRGNISFGLVNIPVTLVSAVKQSEQVRLHLLDRKSHSRIHNQRVNERGAKVDWEDIDHAYEFQKGKYVIVNQKMLEQTAAQNYETVEITEFVPQGQIAPIFFEKPYYLLPGESGVKGYMLLHDILQRTKKIAIARVVIKTREHIAAIMPQQDYLVMITLRYAKDLYALSDLLEKNPLHNRKFKVQAKELKLAEQLVANMTANWNPKSYHDDNKELLLKLIKGDIKRGKAVTDKSSRGKKAKGVSGTGAKTAYGANVVDFMSLLKKSVADKNKRTGKGKPKSRAQHSHGHATKKRKQQR